MNDIQLIGNVHGYVDSNDKVWLNAEDVAKGFGFTQVKNGVEYVKWERVNSYLAEFRFSPRVGKDSYIPENMVYRLGFKASNEVAVAFQNKLADEILPSIRKHGAYLTPQKIEDILSDPDTIIKLATELKDERQKRLEAEKQIETNKPKVVFADAITSSRNSCLVGELAKLIKQAMERNGMKVPIGQNRFFKWLRDNGYLGKSFGYRNIANQEYIEQGLFELKKTVHDENGVMVSKTTTKVTGKGQSYFVNGFLSGKFTIGD